MGNTLMPCFGPQHPSTKIYVIGILMIQLIQITFVMVPSHVGILAPSSLYTCTRVLVDGQTDHINNVTQA